MIEKWDVNCTEHPQVCGAALALQREYEFMAAACMDKFMLKTDRRVTKMMLKGYEQDKAANAPQPKYRCLVWACPAHYYTNFTYWTQHCWGVTCVNDMEAMLSYQPITIGDKEQALAAGVDLGVLYGELTTLLGGAYINNFSRFGKLYQTYIQAAPEYRLDKRSLDNYYVASSSGESVPVSSFVEVVDTVGVEYVSQFNLYRSISLTVTPAARASTTTVMQEITRTAGEVLPDDIGTAWSGTSYQEANASKTGGLVYLLALVFVFLALAALYESWGLPLAILMSVPVAVLGAVLFIGGSHLLDAFFVNDVYMQISLVMLIGLAAKNAILVVEYADRLFNEKGLSLMDAAIGAAKLRVRPIIMTAFAFILGVMPLVFASGVYATARNIMGVALVGGMLFATLLGIFVYPALYYFVGRIGNFERRRERKKQEEKL